MIIVTRMVILIWPRVLAMPKRGMGILTVKRVMDMTMDLRAVMIMVTRMVEVVTRMGR